MPRGIFFLKKDEQFFVLNHFYLLKHVTYQSELHFLNWAILGLRKLGGCYPASARF